MMDATLQYLDNDPIDILMLLDSGADFPTITKDVAEALGIDIKKCKRDTATGVGGKTMVAWCEIDVSFGQGGHDFDYRMPFHIALAENSHMFPLLGREPIFYDFDVNFRMSYAPPKGKFVLKKVTKHRNPKKFK